MNLSLGHNKATFPDILLCELFLTHVTELINRQSERDILRIVLNHSQVVHLEFLVTIVKMGL